MQLIINVENPLLKHISRKIIKTLNWNGHIYAFMYQFESHLTMCWINKK